MPSTMGWWTHSREQDRRIPQILWRTLKGDLPRYAGVMPSHVEGKQDSGELRHLWGGGGHKARVEFRQAKLIFFLLLNISQTRNSQPASQTHQKHKEEEISQS